MSNSAKTNTYPIVVIGAGAGGLVIAIGATKAGKKVLLIEEGFYGGDCTNFGCIPSKSLIASAHSAFAIKESKKLGIDSLPLTVKANNTLSRVRAIVDEVRSHETPEALSDLGLETLTGLARFEGVNILRVNEKLIHAKQIVIATGSSASIPKIHGLDKTPYLTNETVFGLKEIPKSLTVIGGGPIGCELAQAFLRLGSKTTLVHSHAELLNREDSSARSIIANQFLSEGMILHLKTGVKEVFYDQGRFTILLENGQYFESEALLISVGRKPNVSALNLEAAGVNYHEKGISVDAYGRTNQHHIWAVGDVVGPPFFTHWAESQARSVLTSLLLPFEFKKKIDKTQPIPRVTFTDPEVASAGLTEDEAKENYTTATYTVPFSQVDRAVTTGRTEGFVKIVTKKWSSKILGCTIVGERAGEMLGEVTLAMHAEIPLRKLAGLIHPYPTYNQAIRKAADLWLTQTVLSLFKREDMIKKHQKISTSLNHFNCNGCDLFFWHLQLFFFRYSSNISSKFKKLRRDAPCSCLIYFLLDLHHYNCAIHSRSHFFNPSWRLFIPSTFKYNLCCTFSYLWCDTDFPCGSFSSKRFFKKKSGSIITKNGSRI